MKYFFVLGKNPTLSVAELSAVFRARAEETKSPIGDLVSNDIFVLETNKEINAKGLIKKLGGIIKIGIVDDEFRIKNNKELLSESVKLIDVDKINGKFKFGISYYGKNKFDIRSLGMEIKKYLRKKSVGCRWVTSREPTLSSVVVEQNKLADKGIEIVLVKQRDKILIGRTLAVQPFKELSFRDYGRPARDDRSGMIPPKLAQIMINLAAVETRHCLVSTGERRDNIAETRHCLVSTGERRDNIAETRHCLVSTGERRDNIAETRHAPSLLDPFCGSGTILTEALLMGYGNVIGADISEKAVEDTKKNIAWIKNNFQFSIFNFQLFNKSVLELSKFIKPKSIDAVVTEPYLGPQRGKVDFNKTIKELEDLYGKSLAEFKKVLKPGGRVVMVWPVFQVTSNRQPETKRVTPDINGFKIVNPILSDLRGNAIIKLTDRNTIIYGRKGQKVWREIVVLEATQ